MLDRHLQEFGEPGYFYESPRWHDGHWWVSDFHEHSVFAYTAGGEKSLIATIDDQPSGLGWMPDGSLLIVSMYNRQILRRDLSGAITLHAALADICDGVDGFLNDLVVDGQGRAYVSFDPSFEAHGFDSSKGCIFSISPEGTTRREATHMVFPNGLMITDDGATLIAAETFGARLTSFDIGADGMLGAKEIWADLSFRQDRRDAGGAKLASIAACPDGCGLDADGHVWIADVDAGCLRIARGGAIVDAVFLPPGLHPWACGLGGEDGKTLLICAGIKAAPEDGKRLSRLFISHVDVPHAGMP